jgi:hypothetical protein
MPIDLIQKINLEVDSPKLVKLIVNTFMPYCLGSFSDCQMGLWVKSGPINYSRSIYEQKFPIVIFSNDRFYSSTNLAHTKETVVRFEQKEFTEKILPSLNDFLDKHLFNEALFLNYKEEYIKIHGKLGTHNDFGFRITAREDEFVIGLCSVHYAP